MKEAAEEIGEGARFRKLDLAVTFDDNWSYDLRRTPTMRKHSKTFTNAFGKQQGTCVHCGNCDLGCEVQARNTLDLNYLAARKGRRRRFSRSARDPHPRRPDGWRVITTNWSGRRSPRTSSRKP